MIIQKTLSYTLFCKNCRTFDPITHNMYVYNFPEESIMTYQEINEYIKQGMFYNTCPECNSENIGFRNIRLNDKVIKSVENDLELKINNSVEECILMHHTDMFFTNMFRFIIFVEYEEQRGLFECADLNEVYEKFKKVSALVLFETCNIKVDEYDAIPQIERKCIPITYDDLIQFGKCYNEAISSYVRNYNDVVDVIMSVSNTQKLNTFFFQSCMIAGYKTAHKRIKNNLLNEDYFGHEFTNLKNESVLKIYPTPAGSLRKESFVRLAKELKFDKILDGYLSKIGFERLSNEDLIKEFRTTYIYI